MVLYFKVLFRIKTYSRVREDKDNGKLESVEKMMETGIFWATVKCPRCARNQTVQTTFFYNKCKMCRNVSH